ncbi:MAG TPA: lipoyl(octanoyl) transferase LipB [Candidatus Acidoferrales bacterium]|nr:lipoyl(octanoyl) transferase LipB [Candidatus Acidoferrales bacterium]
MRSCDVYWLGRLPYEPAWRLQTAMVAAVKRGDMGFSLLLLEHPSVFTLGRRADGSNLLWSEARCQSEGVYVVRSDRGGDATYHGPGQLVGYPIVDLADLNMDVWQYVRNLERSLISYLRTVGIESAGGPPGLAGVWVGPDKIAAIGVKLSQSVASHGFALNLTTDLRIFNEGIVPCGLADRRATSVAAVGGPSLDVESSARAFTPHFGECFQSETRWFDSARLQSLGEVAGDAVETLESRF